MTITHWIIIGVAAILLIGLIVAICKRTSGASIGFGEFIADMLFWPFGGSDFGGGGGFGDFGDFGD